MFEHAIVMCRGRSRRAPPGVGRAAEGASALPHGLGVARGSGVTKKLKGIGSTAAAGSGRRTDPLKLQRMLQARKVGVRPLQGCA